MTINKIGLSAFAAVMLSTTASAGILALDTNASVMASELVLGQDYNSTSIDINATYKPSLNAGVNDGKLLITFEGGRIQSHSGLVVVNGTQATVVGSNPQLSGVNSQKLTFDINGSINDYDVLYVSDDANGSAGDNNRTTPDENVSMLLDVLNGSSTVTTTYALLDNVDDSLDTSNASTVLNLETQWTASVVTKFDGQIDAAASFLSFTTATANPDLASIRIASNSNVIVGLPAVVNVTTTMENNISNFGALTEATTAFGAPTLAATTSGYGYDVNSSSQTATFDHNLSFTDAGNTNEMLETTFTTAVSLVASSANAGLPTQTLIASAATNLGEWTIYGYKAQIPNVSGLSTHDTTMKFTNRSGIDTNIYFTLIDPDGTRVTLNSVANPTLAALAQNTTGKYKASELIALVTEADFDASTSFSVEVSIPTTPSKVYGIFQKYYSRSI